MWTIRSRAVRDLRLERVWTLEHLEKVSGVSLRTLRSLEEGDPPVRATTIECLAKAFGVEPSEIARPAGAEPAKSKPSKPPSTPPPPPAATPAGATQLPKPTRLEQLVAMERALPPIPPLVSEGGPIPPLDAKKYQDVFTAYATHEGELAFIIGRVDVQRGLAPDEAALLGTRSGIGARFHFVRTVVEGHEIGMTVHTARPEDTMALQDALGGLATVVVRVVLAPDDVVARGAGFTFFMSERPRPWALRVERVLMRTGPEAPGADGRPLN